MTEIQFQKYKIRGNCYHWEQISRAIRERNIYVVARYQLILNLIGNEIKGKKLLDVGCGDGVLSYLLSRKKAEVTGIDTSNEAIKFVKEKCKHSYNVKFLEASAYEIPFKDKNFDYVVSSETIEHLEYPEKMLSEIKRVWNQNGKVIVTTPIKFTEKPLDEMHYQEFYEEDFKILLEKYFDNVNTIKSHPLFWMEFQNKTISGHSFNKILLNFLNLFFGFNPFLSTKGWRYYTFQTAVIGG